MTREELKQAALSLPYEPGVYLMKNAARAVPRSELLPAVWGIDHNPATRVADDTLKRIRRKLAGSRLSIDTVWGYGFKIREI